MDFKRKHSKEHLGRILVLGKGVTGVALEKYLKTQALRVETLDVVDEQSFRSNQTYDICIASPGISEFSEFYMQASQVSNEIVSEVEFAWRESESDSKWIAITGTNGKTTTTALTKHILQTSGKSAVAVGNIGQTCISQVDGTPKIYVAECSSYQLASIKSFSPDASAILNITPDHIKWHQGLDNYRKAKFKIFKNLGAEDLLFIEDSLKNEIPKLPCEVVTDITSPLRKLVLEAKDDMKIKGEHNVQNSICAAALCHHLGADEAEMRDALRSFSPLEHRIEPCGVIEGVEYFNDSKATNVDSTIKALSAFSNKRVILLLGGVDKMSDLTPLVEACRQRVKNVICFGEAKVRFFEAFKVLKDDRIDVCECEHLSNALSIAKTKATSGDTVLFSPACASFDEFSGFEERGRAFKQMVKGGKQSC